MLPRLVFATIILALLGGAGYAGVNFVLGRQPLPRAQAMLEAGDPRGAQLLLRGLAKSEPRNAEAHVMLARTQLALSDPVAAEKELKIARALRFDRTVVNPLLGQAYLIQERYQDVLADFPATATGSELVQNLAVRSAAYLGLNELGQARASIEAAAREAPEDPAVLLGQAHVALAFDDPIAASALLDHSLRLEPNALQGAMLRADILVKEGRMQDARGWMDKAVTIAPFSIPARLQRANFLIWQGDLKAAKADVDASFGVDWHDSGLLLTNAVLMMQSGKLGDAEAEFQRLAGNFERHPRGYYYQALTASRMDHNEVALDYMSRYLKLVPRNVDGLRLAAKLEMRVGRAERAIEIGSRAEALGIKDAEVFDTLGRAYFMRGQTAEAIDRFRKASALDPGNKEIAAHLTAAQSFGGGTQAAGLRELEPAPENR